ncbi:SDR family NAD(P)-dependent oxidoreductase [Microbispora hainanensis]|uniref:SDR family oxidoreductase n=1 Tax=Microbispora hainanensis TaxID=568844 RepID=A0A544YNP0_9ACTN|nr:SDR family oxidoreductase [Microbispora hainanensis]TQS18370.1 SDR family oxidoreductase [Microbispora hainanensis]
MPTALITGATAGIGAAFARRLAADGFSLVLVARDQGRLAASAEALHKRYGVPVEPLCADLTTEEGTAAAEERLGSGVDLLVNNAGFGHHGGFLDTPVEDEIRMLRLHCEAVLRLTRAALPYMISKRRGGVINVASVAAFLPGGTYSATKAWVVNYSASAANMVNRHGVRVMALCPGFVRTELHDRARLDMSGLPPFAWLSADRVAADAMRDLARGVWVSVPSARYKAIVAIARLLPLNLVGRVARLRYR